VDPLLGTAGVAGVLAVVIGYLLRQNFADRRQYQNHIAEVQTSTAAAIASAKASHAKEIGDLTAKVDALTTLYEDTRRAKWAAEDEAAKYRRLYELGVAQGGAT
jgi:outer membrane murein-binding lipoprotein Lpp